MSCVSMVIRRSLVNCHIWQKRIPTSESTPFHIIIRTLSTKDLQTLFIDPKVHTLLRLITYRNPEVAHNPRFQQLQKNKIKMLNDEELKAVKTFSSAFTSQRLQMPPVLAARNDDDGHRLISTDSNLQGLIPRNNKLVFTDISLGRSRRNRLIVVREPNGDLRHASAAERERVNNVYFPIPGRCLRTPLMFSPEHLQNLLARRQFLYVLNRACAQFEPDDPEYIRVCHAVFDAVNQLAWTPIGEGSDDTNPLRDLRHTRHFGPLALYMIVELSNPGPLVYEAISCQHFARLGWLLQLFVLARPEAKFSVMFREMQPDSNIPYPEIKETTESSDEIEMKLTPSDATKILTYAEMFVNNEPLSEPHKRLLRQHLELCREGLKEKETQESVG